MNFGEYLSKLMDKALDVLSMGRVLSVVFPGVLVGAGFVMLLSLTFSPGVGSRTEQLQSQAIQKLTAAQLAWGNARSDSVVCEVREMIVASRGHACLPSDSLRSQLLRVDSTTRVRVFGPVVSLMDSLAQYVPADERIAAGDLSIRRNWLSYQGAVQIRRDFEHVKQLWFVVLLLGIVLGFLVAAQGYTNSRIAPWMMPRTREELPKPRICPWLLVLVLSAIVGLAIPAVYQYWPEVLRSRELSALPGLPFYLLAGACLVWAAPRLCPLPRIEDRIKKLDALTADYSSTLMRSVPVMDRVGQQKRDYLAYINQEYYRFSEFACNFPEALFWFFMTIGLYFAVMYLKGMAGMFPSLLAVSAALVTYVLFWLYWLPQVAGPGYLKYRAAARNLAEGCKEVLDKPPAAGGTGTVPATGAGTAASVTPAAPGSAAPAGSGTAPAADTKEP
jgi:hypothetical protein